MLTASGELKFRGVEGDRNINEFKFYCLGHAPSLEERNIHSHTKKKRSDRQVTTALRPGSAPSCPISSMSPFL